MLQPIHRIIARGWVALAMATAAIASAEEGAVGMVNAVAFEPLPSKPIFVRTLDDSDFGMAVRAAVVDAMIARGLIVGPETSPLLLTIDSSQMMGAVRSVERPVSRPVEDRSGRLSFREGFRAQEVPGAPPPTGVIGARFYQLELTLDERADRRRLWRGWAVADLGAGDPPAIAQAMVPELAASIGETVRERVFPLAGGS
jgi:hypothetical protein